MIAAVLVLLLLLVSWWAGIAIGCAALIVGGAVVHVNRRGREAALRAAAASESSRALGRLAGALTSGMELTRALEVGAADRHRFAGKPGKHRIHKETGSRLRLAEAASLARMGGDPAEVIAAGGQQGARHLAMCLAATNALGIAPRVILHDLAEAEARRLKVVREVGLALASARATARLLAALPLFGVGLAGLISSGSIRILFTGSVGRGCLLMAAMLEAGGLVWMQRISDGAER